MHKHTQKRGISTIELIVVLAILGLLAALVLPALQSARETARRSSCANNLRQLAIAIEGHRAAIGRFPEPAFGESMKGWSITLLPYIEQNKLYQRFRRENPPDDPLNVAAGQHRPATFVCPSGEDAVDFHLKVPVAHVAYNSFLAKYRNVPTGSSSTMLLAETHANPLQSWTTALEIPLFDENSTPHPEGVNVAFADGHVAFVAKYSDVSLFPNR